MAAPEAKAIIRADNRKLRGDLAKSRSMFKRSFANVGAGIRRSLTGGLAALGVGTGIAGFAGLGKSVLEFEDVLNRLQIQSGASGAEMEKLRGEMIALSTDTGISRNEIAGTGKALVDLLGASGASIENISLLAKANLATGASMQDLAGLVLTLQNAMDITDPKELERGLSAITQAGKEGAIPLDRMAVILQKVGGTFAKTGGTGVKGAARLSAALQVLRSSANFGTAEESATGLQAALTALGKKGGDLSKLGVKVFDKGEFRDFFAILRDFKAAGLTTEKLITTLGRTEATKAIGALIDGYSELNKLTDSGLRSAAIGEDSEKRRLSTAFKLQKRFNTLRETFIKLFTPERIEKFVAAMAKLGELAGFLVGHLKTFAALFATIKIGSFAVQMTMVAKSTQAAAAASIGMAGGLGKAATAFGALSALAAGFSLGTALDEIFGLSDKLSDLLVSDFGAGKGFEESGFLRDRAAGVRASTGIGGAVLGGAGIGGGGAKQAEDLLRQLAAQGILTPKGIDVEAAAASVTKGPLTGPESAAAAGGIAPNEQTRELLDTIKTAQAILKESRSKPIDVRITVDQDGQVVGAVGAERTGAVE